MLTNADKGVISELANRWPDVDAARELWLRAGGRAKDVRNSADPAVLWSGQWARARQGDRVTCTALVSTALEDLPRNDALLNWLAQQPSGDRKLGDWVAEELRQAESVTPELVEELVRKLSSVAPSDVTTVVAPALRSVPKEKVGGFKALLEKIAPVGKAGLEIVTKTTIEALVKAVFASHGL